MESVTFSTRTDLRRAHGGLPCPEECALYRKVGERSVMYQRCGGCQVDHICPLACCGLDAPQNMQWLTAEANRAKSGGLATSMRRAERRHDSRMTRSVQ